MGLAKIEDNEIVIRIPIDTIQFAADVLSEGEDDEIVVTDAQAAAKEIVIALNDEEEDGDTLVHSMMDAALLRALDNGADGFDFQPSEEYD